jgi:hypothetical protein
MWGWLFASMSGLMRTATRAGRPILAAIASTRSSSPVDSTLIAYRWDGAFELGGRLADASEDNVGRSKTGAPGDIDLPDRIGIHAAAEIPQCLHDPEGRIGLERVVQPVRVIGERQVDLAVAIADGRCAVDVYGRTFGARDR